MATKLSPTKVRAIRRKWDSGRYWQRELAAQYDVTQASISAIVTGRTWRDVVEVHRAKRSQAKAT